MAAIIPIMPNVIKTSANVNPFLFFKQLFAKFDQYLIGSLQRLRWLRGVAPPDTSFDTK